MGRWESTEWKKYDLDTNINTQILVFSSVSVTSNFSTVPPTNTVYLFSTRSCYFVFTYNTELAKSYRNQYSNFNVLVQMQRHASLSCKRQIWKISHYSHGNIEVKQVLELCNQAEFNLYLNKAVQRGSWLTFNWYKCFL